jgi:hypothetical protein
MIFSLLWQFTAFRIALLCAGALFVGYCLSLDWFARLGWFVVRTFFKALRRAIWYARHTRRFRVRKRRPIRSSRRDAKRAAHRYAKEITGRDISWKKARQLLNRLEREGRAIGDVA